MLHRDDAAIAVAVAAAILCGGVWVLGEGGPVAAREPAGLERASRQALESEPADGPLLWRESVNGPTAIITPARAFRGADGRRCRPYTVELSRDRNGSGSRTHHVACRDGFGRWRLLPSEPAMAFQTAFDHWLSRLMAPPEPQAADLGG